jgi:tetratricopeptide (TPR) repeat protein
MERLDEAELTYRMALSNATTRWAADRGLGMIAAARGDFSTASRHYKAAWDASPSDLGLWESWAFAVIKLGDPVTPFQMLEKYQPLDANLLMKWADALASVGRLDEALGCFRRAMTLAPQDSNIQFSCGDLLYKLGYYPQAAEMYHVGLQLRPEFAEGWFVLGNAMAQMNLDQGAEGCYRQALNLDPNHTKAKANLNVVIAA